ncbi:MAG TPA: hypothetical protein VFW07_09505 [Parafilimonas sp.]|nr:hypothetical protein [Parafilimonas sp.]
MYTNRNVVASTHKPGTDIAAKKKGNKIGTDGVNDGKVVVVTDKEEVKTIKATDKAGGTTQASDVKSGVNLPNASVRGEMGKAVDRMEKANNNRTDEFKGNDDEGGFPFSAMVCHE